MLIMVELQMAADSVATCAPDDPMRSILGEQECGSRGLELLD